MQYSLVRVRLHSLPFNWAYPATALSLGYFRAMLPNIGLTLRAVNLCVKNF